MNKTYSFLFPGQGSQFVGMGKNNINNYTLSNKLYEEGSNILGYDIKEISLIGGVGSENKLDAMQSYYLPSREKRNALPFATSSNCFNKFLDSPAKTKGGKLDNFSLATPNSLSFE